MRKTIKVLVATLTTALVLVAGLLALLFYPGILFSHAREHNNFTVYSEDELGDEVAAMLDDIDRALERSTIHDRAMRHELIFGHGNATFTLVQRIKWGVTSGLTGIQPALTYNETAIPYFSHIITFRIPDVERNILSDPDTGAEIDLRRTLAHEVVHSLLQAAIGPEVVRYPMWKQEGYAEYVAAFTGILSGARYEFWSSVQKIVEHDLSWMRDGSGQYAPMRYGCQREATIANEDGRLWPSPSHAAN